MTITKYNNGLLDFHNHSTYSDGGDTPKGLVKRAVEQGVSAIALTDHHTNKGLPEFRDACKEYDILGIPFGTEISARLPKEIIGKKDNEAPDLIILGKNVKEEPMEDYQKKHMNYVRQVYLPETLRGLESVGFKIPNVDLDEQCASFHCPPDILHDFVHQGNNLQTLINYVQSIDSNIDKSEIEAKPRRFINRYLYTPGMPAHITVVGEFDVDDALSLVDTMNCKLFIAHSGGEYGSLKDKIISHYIQKGIHGIEVRNYFNTQEQNEKFDKLAKEHNLIRSGGSDCHGDNGPFKIGCYDRPQNQLPSKVLEELWYGLPE